jgi:hypothetical protein
LYFDIEISSTPNGLFQTQKQGQKHYTVSESSENKQAGNFFIPIVLLSLNIRHGT